MAKKKWTASQVALAVDAFQTIQRGPFRQVLACLKMLVNEKKRPRLDLSERVLVGIAHSKVSSSEELRELLATHPAVRKVIGEMSILATIIRISSDKDEVAVLCKEFQYI